jgi:PAS domain S-box-containing protein
MEIIYINRALSKTLDYSNNELVGKHVSTLFLDKNHEEIELEIEKILNNQRKESNFEIVTKQQNKLIGAIRFISSYFNAKKALIGIIYPMSKEERSGLNGKQQDKAKFYDNILDAIQDGINIIDKNYNNVLVNFWMEKMYPFQDTLLDKKCYEVYQQRESVCPWCPCEKTFNSRDAATSIVPYPSSEAPQGWIELTAFPIKDEKGDVTHIIEYVKDISKRVLTEDQLKKSEERYKTLFQNTPIGIAITTFDGSIRAMNDQMKRITGFESVEDFNKVKVPSTYKNPQEREILIEKIKKNQRVRNFETTLIRKNGETFNGLLNIDLIEIEDEQLLLTSMQDISHLKNIETNLRHSQKKYKDAFNRAEFYKDIFAHDMNNILQNILGSLELNHLIADKSNSREILKETYNSIKNQIKRGANLISNVRKLSEIEEYDLEFSKIDINKLLEKKANEIKGVYTNKDLTIMVNNHKKELFIDANELLEDVIENLLQNAILHNENQYIEITINIMEEGSTHEGMDFVRIEFIDNAKGIEDDRKKKIFERATKGAKGVRGMGLGLSLVKKIIEIYGGKIWVENRVENDYRKGSNFILLIPKSL